MKVGQVRLWKNPWGNQWCIYVIVKQCQLRWVWHVMFLTSDSVTDTILVPGTLSKYEDVSTIIENSTVLASAESGEESHNVVADRLKLDLRLGR